jgi:hypothetical protein
MGKLVFLFSLLILASCTKDTNCANSEHAELKNLTGLDGCGWVVELDNGSKLEPQNLSDFDVELVEGKDVHIRYTEVGGGSICMVGQIVTIDCLSED